MRPVSMVSSLPPKLTPSRTNMSHSLGSNAAATDSSLFSRLESATRHLHSMQRAQAAGKRMNTGYRSRGVGSGAPRRDSPRATPRASLLADTEGLDDRSVTVEVLVFEIVQQSPALADQHEQAAARVVILRVSLEVLGQVRDPLRQQRDLHLGRARVTGFASEFLNDLGLTFCC